MLGSKHTSHTRRTATLLLSTRQVAATPLYDAAAEMICAMQQKLSDQCRSRLAALKSAAGEGHRLCMPQRAACTRAVVQRAGAGETPMECVRYVAMSECATFEGGCACVLASEHALKQHMIVPAVAAAAPATPQSQTDMNKKSRAMLTTAAALQPMTGAFISFTAKDTPTVGLAGVCANENRWTYRSMQERERQRDHREHFESRWPAAQKRESSGIEQLAESLQ